MTPDTLTPGDVARYCGVTPATVSRWITSGKLPGVQLTTGGHRRVRTADFIEFLHQQKQPIPVELTESVRVLIVEDEAVEAMEIAQILEGAGYETRIASSGFEAGVLLDDFRPAVMTLDLNMPGVSGHQVLRTLRENGKEGMVRILVISALSGAELIHAVEEGADKAISKPFTSEKLISMVDCLSGYQREGASHGPRA